MARGSREGTAVIRPSRVRVLHPVPARGLSAWRNPFQNRLQHADVPHGTPACRSLFVFERRNSLFPDTGRDPAFCVPDQPFFCQTCDFITVLILEKEVVIAMDADCREVDDFCAAAVLCVGTGKITAGLTHVFPALRGRDGRVSVIDIVAEIDNDGDYCPENCRWETDKVQGVNHSNSILVTIMGTTMCLNDWARAAGVWRQTIYQWRKAGIMEEKIRKRLPHGYTGRTVLIKGQQVTLYEE